MLIGLVLDFFMVFELWQTNMWRFWLLLCPDWEAVTFFLQVISGLRTLFVGSVVDGSTWFLVHFSMLQRYGLVVGCCVLYWFVEFGTWLWYFSLVAKTLFS